MNRHHSNHHEILACTIDDYDVAGFAETAAHFGHSRYAYAVTPNTDHLIRLHDEAVFRQAYRQAAYVLLDSRLLAHLLRLLRGQHLPVCTGSDLVDTLFRDVIRGGDSLVLIGGTTRQAAELRRRYNLSALAHYNPPMGFIGDALEVEACLRFIEAQSPFRFCLLAVGAPQQERLAQLLGERGIARGLALCVGASVNFLTGSERRAPDWMQQLGLEWLYRLLQDPQRLARRYLVRGPRVFGLLARTRFVLRRPAVLTATT